MSKSGLWRALAALAAMSMLVAACSSSSKSSVGTATTVGSTGTTASTTAVDLDKEALAFVGGTAGAADASKTPITVGYVNQEGGALSFPDATAGVEAAVDLVNNKMGGIGGHSIKLIKCLVQSEEDGAKCGTQLLNNADVKFVMVGMLVVGGASLYNVVNGQKPVMILNPLTQADYNAKQGYAFSGGVAAGYLAIGQFMSTKLSPQPKSVAILTTSNPAGVAAINGLVSPTLNKAGITDIRIAQISDTATGPDVVSAVQAAKTDTADAILVSLQTSGCISAYDAMQQLHITKPVVTTGLCYAKPVAQHLNGKFPEGWIFSGLGWNPYLPAKADVPNSWALPLNVREVLARNKDADPTGPAVYTFGPMLTIAKLMNQVGADNLTPASFGTAMKAYHGPLLGTAGNADCGKNPAFPTVCGSAVGFEKYSNGQFVPVADGYLNNAIMAW